MPPDLLGDLQALLDAELGRIGASAQRGVLVNSARLLTLVAMMLGFLLIAIGVFLQLLATHGPVVAGLWVGGGLILFSAIVGGVAMSVAGRRAKRQAVANAAIARAMMSEDVTKMLATVKVGGSGTLVLAGAALLAGIVAGRRSD